MESTQTSDSLAPIARVNVFREVLARIESFISTQGLTDGDRLPSDRQLALDLGVSRPVVRQALKVLEGRGRIVAQQGVGTFVRGGVQTATVEELTRGIDVGAATMDELIPLRAAVEVQVIRAAFQYRSPENIALIERTLSTQARHLIEAPLEVDLDLALESAFGSVCGSEFLRRIQALVHELWLQGHLAMQPRAQDKNRFHHDHQQIVAAFRHNDEQRAVELMSAHINALPTD